MDEKKTVPHIQCWTDSLTLPALNHPTDIVVWVTAEPGQESSYSLDVHTFCLNVPQLAWSSAFLGTEVYAVIKEPPLRTEQWPWHLSGYKESQEHQVLITEWWLSSLCLGVGTTILPVRWKNLLLPAWPVQLLSSQEWSPLQHLLLAPCSSCSSYSSSRSIRGQIFPPSPSKAQPVAIWLMKVLLRSHC